MTNEEIRRLLLKTPTDEERKNDAIMDLVMSMHDPSVSEAELKRKVRRAAKLAPELWDVEGGDDD